jgi:hypothetical protein
MMEKELSAVINNFSSKPELVNADLLKYLADLDIKDQDNDGNIDFDDLTLKRTEIQARLAQIHSVEADINKLAERTQRIVSIYALRPDQLAGLLSQEVTEALEDVRTAGSAAEVLAAIKSVGLYAVRNGAAASTISVADLFSGTLETVGSDTNLSGLASGQSLWSPNFIVALPDELGKIAMQFDTNGDGKPDVTYKLYGTKEGRLRLVNAVSGEEIVSSYDGTAQKENFSIGSDQYSVQMGALGQVLVASAQAEFNASQVQTLLDQFNYGDGGTSSAPIQGSFQSVQNVTPIAQQYRQALEQALTARQPAMTEKAKNDQAVVNNAGAIFAEVNAYYGAVSAAADINALIGMSYLNAAIPEIQAKLTLKENK